MACFRDVGNSPDFRDKLMIAVNDGSIEDEHSFKSHVGIMSREQDLFGSLQIIFLTSSSVTGLNSVMSAFSFIELSACSSPCSEVLTSAL